MNIKDLTPKFFVLSGMILAAAFTRLIPHPPNFTAVAAIALFSGANFNKRFIAFLVPITAMLITDIIIGFHATVWAVYLSFILIVLLGTVVKKHYKISNIFFASVAASVLFFIITNFAFWTTGLMFPMNLTGLMESYIAAIPFFHYTLFGDLFFVGVLFGALEFAKLKYPEFLKQIS